MNAFKGVLLALPEGACDGFDWQNVKWFVLAVGELRVDPASFSLVFLPGGPTTAKPLGCLLSAVPVADHNGGRAIVVKTNDSMHFMLRLGFQTPTDVENFLVLAQTAEAAGARRACPTPCRTPSRRTPGRGRESLSDRFTFGVGEQHPGRTPLIYSGAELYGPDPFTGQNSEGSEVLLGRGAVALVDPEADGQRVGSYELVFYEEDMSVVFRSFIGPRMRLSEQQEDELATGRLTLASRISMSRPGVARCFDLLLEGEPARAIAFDMQADAVGFQRDFEVRHRVVALALKASRGLGVADALRREMEEMRRNGPLFVLRRLLGQMLLLAVAVVLAQIAVLRLAQPERPMMDIAWSAVSDAQASASAAGEALAVAGEALCTMATRAVPASAVQRCASLPKGVGEEFLRRCVMYLLSDRVS